MEVMPVIAIVGRPNVGKSLLFNQLIEEQKAAVHDIPGLTRDRIYGVLEWQGHWFHVIDTGGYEILDHDPVKKHIREQVEIAIEQANIILFVVDGRMPLTTLDHQIAQMLRKSAKPIFLLVNKCDNQKQDMDAMDYYELGFSSLFPVSALHRRGLTEVLDVLTVEYPARMMNQADSEMIKVAVCGRQNVGKSTLVNMVSGEYRVIASEIPGTTRDSIDTPIQMDGQDYLLIDTAGLRRKSKISDRLEKLAVISALLSIYKSDVVIFMMDANLEIVAQDLKIAALIEKAGKSMVVAMNKWDKIQDKDKTARELKKIIREKLHLWINVPIVYVSALDGKNCSKLFRRVKEVYGQYMKRIPTPELNNALHEIIAKRPPTPFRGHICKFYYGVQVKVAPPAFELFVNNRQWIHTSYQRYLKKNIKDRFHLEGTSIRLYFRGKEKSKK